MGSAGLTKQIDDRHRGHSLYVSYNSGGKKGATLELAHRNSQASVPFMISSRGYGFFWNNPAIGTATFGTNKTEWNAKSTKKLDYFITAGDTPFELEEQYSAATGRLTGAPIMRPLFFDFNGDEMAWETEDEYMFGPDILVAPVMEEKVTQRSVYLPAGAAWTDANTGEVYRGGQSAVVPAPLDIIPVFFRDGKKYDIYQ